MRSGTGPTRPPGVLVVATTRATRGGAPAARQHPLTRGPGTQGSSTWRCGWNTAPPRPGWGANCGGRSATWRLRPGRRTRRSPGPAASPHGTGQGEDQPGGQHSHRALITVDHCIVASDRCLHASSDPRPIAGGRGTITSGMQAAGQVRLLGRRARALLAISSSDDLGEIGGDILDERTMPPRPQEVGAASMAAVRLGGVPAPHVGSTSSSSIFGVLR